MFNIKHILLGTTFYTTVVAGVFGGLAHAVQLEERVVVTRYVTQWYNRTSTVSGTYAFGTGGTGMFPTGGFPTGAVPTGSGHVGPTGHVGYNGTVGVAPVKGVAPTGHVGYNGTVGVAPVYGNMTIVGDITTVLSTIFVLPTGFVDRGSLGDRAAWLLNNGTNGTMTAYSDSIKPTATSIEGLYGDTNPDLLGKRGKRETVEQALSASRAAQMQKHTTSVGFLGHNMILRGVEPTHTPDIYAPEVFTSSIGKLVDNEVVAQLAKYPHNGGDLDDEVFAKVIQDADKTVRASRQAHPVHSREVVENAEDVSEEDLIEVLIFLDLLGLIDTDSKTTKRDDVLALYNGNVTPLEKLNQSVEEAINAIGDDFPGLPKGWIRKLHYTKREESESLTGNVTPLQTLRQTVEEEPNAVRKDLPGLPKKWFRGGPSVDADIEVPSYNRYNRTGSVNNSTTGVTPTRVRGKPPSVPVPTLEPQVPWLTAELAEQRYRNRRPESAVEKRQIHNVGTAPHYDISTGTVNPTGTAPMVDMHIPAANPAPTLVSMVELLTPDLFRQCLEHRHSKRDAEELEAVEGTGEPLEIAKRDPGRRLGESKLFKSTRPGMETTDSELEKCGRRLGENKLFGNLTPGMETTDEAVEYVSPPLDAIRRAPGRILGEEKIFRNIKPGMETTDCKTYVLEIANGVTKTISTVGAEATGHVKRTPTTLIKVMATGVKAN